jgi:hypothetical protein
VEQLECWNTTEVKFSYTSEKMQGCHQYCFQVGTARAYRVTFMKTNFTDHPKY